jgi:hypothetical protein
MPGFSINEFRSQLTGAGARPNLFEVTVPFPGISNAGESAQKMKFMCKSASIPGSDIAPVEVPYFGRQIKLAGNRTFAEWATTVINDEDFAIHSGIVNWMDAIQSHTQSLRRGGVNDYQVDALVTQYGKTGENIKEITFINLWPSSMAAIELGWDTNDALEEFAVTWQYDYWTITDGRTATN